MRSGLSGPSKEQCVRNSLNMDLFVPGLVTFVQSQGREEVVVEVEVEVEPKLNLEESGLLRGLVSVVTHQDLYK